MISNELRTLCALYGVQTSHVDGLGGSKEADPDVLLSVLGALGAPVSGDAGILDAIRTRCRDVWLCHVDPVVVCDAGEPLTVDVRVRADESIRVTVGDVTSAGGEVVESEDVDGVRYERRRHRLEARLEPGYHDLHAGEGPVSLLVAAPGRAPDHGGRRWGAFLPLYSLRSKRSWGTGDLTDLESLGEWTRSLGAHFVATLPLYAQYLDGRIVDASPYAPVSRLHWNELYADAERAPELALSPEARDFLGSNAFAADLKKAREADRVDYGLAYALKRRVLLPLSRVWKGKPADAVADYARFRARGAADVEREYRYHAYVQTLMRAQLEHLGRMYLDVPVGVHSRGYDTWRYGEVFAAGVRAGAPPDPLFAAGQDWGFPPLHRDGLRATRYAYFIAVLREAFARSSALRLDHVMALHRLYWIPEGAGAGDGVYVTYPHHEFYAVLLVEAQRAGAMVVGEDLGTVPREVRDEMKTRGVFRMHVAQFEPPPPAPVSLQTFASLGTHDTPAFAAWWNGPGEPPTRDWLLHLASSTARSVIVNLEDLWGERQPQNVPGTASEQNWRRKAALTLEDMRSVEGLLREIDEARRFGKAAGR